MYLMYDMKGGKNYNVYMFCFVKRLTDSSLLYKYRGCELLVIFDDEGLVYRWTGCR